MNTLRKLEIELLAAQFAFRLNPCLATAEALVKANGAFIHAKMMEDTDGSA